MRHVLALLAALFVLAACENSPSAPEGTVFVVEVVPGETFRILVTTPEQVADARAMLQSGEERVVMGELARGSGGFNSGYRWHLKPQTVSIVDAAVEICDGRPSFVEAELDYWMANVKTYCPWGARIVREETT